MSSCDSQLALRLTAALEIARRELLALRNPKGCWTGELSSSALSTATAVCALAVVARHAPERAPQFEPLIRHGLEWLVQNANTDGGWGDTIRSLSNISTTALGWAAFGAVPGADQQHAQTVERAAHWLTRAAGGIEPDRLAPAIIARYGKDRTFSVPILTMCALAGRLGEGRDAWRWVLPLPFELAACPHRWFATLRLPVVSYALPALIAIGQARHHHLPSRNPLARLTRALTRARTLEVLREIQPASGGFLEATPLTSFVTMSLAGSGQVHHPTTLKAVEFLCASARADGSWPIDTNLATWVTTLSVNALHAVEGAPGPSSAIAGSSAARSLSTQTEWQKIVDWILNQQFWQEHPYTHAAPGGWAWTDLPGGVPDADDTAGALLTLRFIGGEHPRVVSAAARGVEWLLRLQNRDGGIPTFCRGWGALPFDRSSPDLTAHALRAWSVWLDRMPPKLQRRIARAMDRALDYLARSQTPDGAWIPLWFGNQFAHDDANPTYGTSRVLAALATLHRHGLRQGLEEMNRGVNYLLGAQDVSGAWGGDRGTPVSVEETALALEALGSSLLCRASLDPHRTKEAKRALARGAEWLMARVEDGTWREPSPIGFYFAKLWYYERLYPVIFTVGALTTLEEAVGDSA